MAGFILRTLISAMALWVASALLPGMSIHGFGNLLLSALLLGLVNALVRPVAVFFTLPLSCLTLGLFLFVINAAMLGLVARIVSGFYMDGWFTAILGSVIVGIVGSVASWTIGPKGRFEVMVARRD